MRILSLLLLLLVSLPVAAQEPLSPLFQKYDVQSVDSARLVEALGQAVTALTPYKDRALEGPLPLEVDNFFRLARALSQEYKVRGGDLLMVPQSLMIGSGRFEAGSVEEAFGPLSQLLNQHLVSGTEVLDLIAPGIEQRLEQVLRTPPDQRQQMRAQPGDGQGVQRGLEFARRHRIPLPQLVQALSSLGRLKAY